MVDQSWVQYRTDVHIKDSLFEFVEAKKYIFTMEFFEYFLLNFASVLLNVIGALFNACNMQEIHIYAARVRLGNVFNFCKFLLKLFDLNNICVFQERSIHAQI